MLRPVPDEPVTPVAARPQGRAQGDDIVSHTLFRSTLTDSHGSITTSGGAAGTGNGTGGGGTAVAEAAPLVYQRCRWCRTAVFQRALCPVCASTDLDEERSAGHGTVTRSTVVHRNTSAVHNLSLIDMAEGFSVRCRVIGAPPDAVRPGARVKLATAVDPNRPELVFQLCDSPYGGWL
jgi:uncharacterized OB-fold protein